jgi:hypothetical protein
MGVRKPGFPWRPKRIYILTSHIHFYSLAQIQRKISADITFQDL